MHRGPVHDFGSPLDLDQNFMNAMAYRNAMYAPPYKAMDGQAGVHQPPTNHLGLTFDQMPKPPTREGRVAMAPARPPYQDEPALTSHPPYQDDSSSVSTVEDTPLWHHNANPYAVFTALEWRLRRQSKRLKKKIRAMRQDMRQVYEAIYFHLRSNNWAPHPPHQTQAKPSAPTSLWCLVVGLAVGFVFLLIFVILCWVRVPAPKA